MAVVIPIVTEFVGKGVERAIKEFRQIEGVAGKAAFVFNKALVPGAVAAAGAITGLGVTLFKAAQAAAEAQQEDAILATQLRNVVGATDEAIATTLEFVDALEMESLISGGDLATNLALLTRITGNLETAQSQLVLATDIASGAQLDLGTVSQALAKAYQGNFEALKKLGIPIDENTIKTKDYAKVQKILTDQFGGSAAKNADTFQGKLEQLKIGWGRIVETVGQLVLPYLQRFVDFVNTYIVPALNVFITQLTGGKGVDEALKIAIASMGDLAPAAIQSMRAAANATLEFVRALTIAYTVSQSLLALVKLVLSKGKGIQGAQAIADLLKALAGGAAIVVLNKTKTSVNDFFDDLINNFAKYQAAAAAVKPLTLPTVTNTTVKVTEFDDALTKVAKSAKSAEEKVKELSEALSNDMNKALQGAEENLKNALQDFQNFAEAVENVINEALDFNKAFEASAEEGGGSFFEELQKQANKAKEFGVLVEKLLAAGISKDALDQVLAAGVDSGIEIAKQLLGAADGVLKANTLVEETKAIAEKIGAVSANQFYLAGVQAGQAYLQGIQEAIAAANLTIASAKRPADIKGAAALFADSANKANSQRGVVNNYTINSQSLDPKRSGDVIVDALKDYNRRSGPLQLQIE